MRQGPPIVPGHRSCNWHCCKGKEPLQFRASANADPSKALCLQFCTRPDAQILSATAVLASIHH
jgi:hypothetical protein